MPSQADISSQIITNLNAVEPDLDVSIGTTLRKIVDVFSLMLSDGYQNNNVLQSQNSITSLTGSALDSFAFSFGMLRFPAKYAYGVVTFTRPANQSQTPYQALGISSGIAVSTSDSPPIFFTTAVPAFMSANELSVDVPVSAAIAGVAGNIPANSIININVPLQGISSVTNALAISGGSDAESDAAFQQRFLNTVFRGLIGTAQSFEGTALENPNTTAANALGAQTPWSEYLEIVGGTATSTVTDAKYIYQNTVFFGPSLPSSILTNNVDYSLSIVPLIGAPTIFVGYYGDGNLEFDGLKGDTYTYQVVFQNQYGMTLPSEPQSITATVDGQPLSSFSIAWGVTPPGVTNVLVFGRVAGNMQLIADLPYTETEFIDTGNPDEASGFGVPFPILFPLNFGDDTLIEISSITGVSFPINFNFSFGGGGLGPEAYTGPMVPTVNTAGLALEIDSINPFTCPDGVYQLQFDYVPFASRNDPTQNIYNKVDLYLAGEQAQNVSQTAVNQNLQYFSDNPESILYIKNFQRLDGSNPSPRSVLLPLSYMPLISLPSAIEFSLGPQAYVYNQNVDYFMVNQIGNQGMSDSSLGGIELSPELAWPEQLTIDYNYNSLPSAVDIAIQHWRLLSTDVMVHQALPEFLNIYLVVLLASGMTLSSAQPAIFAAIQSVVSNITFNGVLEASSIIGAVAAVPSVQSVRFAQPGDNEQNFAIQSVAEENSDVLNTYALQDGTTTDVAFDQVTYPVLNNVVCTQRSQNTFRRGA